MLTLVALGVAGCSSKQDKALEQAKKQAAATGQAQQVVSVDSHGNTTTTVVQPPQQGQKEEAVTTMTTPPPVGSPKPAPADPAVSVVPPPPAPPAPVQVTIPSGTAMAIRVDQTINTRISHAGDKFTGEVVDPIQGSDGGVLVPKGTRVAGRVEASRKRGHFKGASLLELRLTSMTLNGTEYPLETHDLKESKMGKGKRTAAMIGGGAGLGMLVGGVASGGVGLLVGGLAGGGAGTAVAGLTGNRDISIAAETVVRFTLAEDLVVTTGKQEN